MSLHATLDITVLPRTFYVDGTNGNDANDGWSETAPWKTIAKVNAAQFSPNEWIKFKCGETWNNGTGIDPLTIVMDHLTLASYGDGAAPLMRNPGVTWGHVIKIATHHVSLIGLHLQDAHEGGVSIVGDYNSVQSCETNSVGQGVMVNGEHNLITRNVLHDGTMVVNDATAFNDYGAMGVILYRGNNEVSYNQIYNMAQPSHDYGMDGSAVELSAQTFSANGNKIHHNYAHNCNCFTEVSGKGMQVHDLSYYDNVISDCGSPLGNGEVVLFHNSGSSGVDLLNMTFDANTLVFHPQTYPRQYATVWFSAVPAVGAALFRDNLFYLDWVTHFFINAGANVAENHNLVYRKEGATCVLGLTLNGTDPTVDPQLVNVASGDYHLQMSSPAKHAGMDVGVTDDYDGAMRGSPPSIGAYE